MNDSIITKICSKCQVEKPVSEFSKDKSKKDGLQRVCKICDKKKASEYYQSHKEEKSEYRLKYYKSHKEKITKSRQEYYQINREKIVETQRKYRQSHKEEKAEYCREYYLSNKEDFAEYYQLHKEKIIKYSREYSQSHKEEIRKYYQSHKEEIAEYQKTYLKTDIGKENKTKANHKRRALKAGATVEDFSPTEVFERDDYICQSCGIKTRPDFKNQYHPKYPNLDHIIPLSKGGEHSKRNTQCLCVLCNLTKYNTGLGDQLRLF